MSVGGGKGPVGGEICLFVCFQKDMGVVQDYSVESGLRFCELGKLYIFCLFACFYCYYHHYYCFFFSFVVIVSVCLLACLFLCLFCTTGTLRIHPVSLVV